jgi:uncharacterized protein YbbK (DUF523 family)
MILVSACLAGLKVRYDGRHCKDEEIKKLIENGEAVPICPEVIGGLPIPRLPAEIIGGTGEDVLSGKAKVIDINGQDVTQTYIKGAVKTLEKAEALEATVVVLKENSPSCGSAFIYNGNFSGDKISGEGVTAALLRRHQIRVLSEKEFMGMFE